MTRFLIVLIVSLVSSSFVPFKSVPDNKIIKISVKEKSLQRLEISSVLNQTEKIKALTISTPNRQTVHVSAYTTLTRSKPEVPPPKYWA